MSRAQPRFSLYYWGEHTVRDFFQFHLLALLLRVPSIRRLPFRTGFSNKSVRHCNALLSHKPIWKRSMLNPGTVRGSARKERLIPAITNSPSTLKPREWLLAQSSLSDTVLKGSNSFCCAKHRYGWYPTKRSESLWRTWMCNSRLISSSLRVWQKLMI